MENFPGKNIGVGCHFLLQGFSNSGINLTSPVSLALAGGLFTAEPSERPVRVLYPSPNTVSVGFSVSFLLG